MSKEIRQYNVPNNMDAGQLIALGLLSMVYDIEATNISNYDLPPYELVWTVHGDDIMQAIDPLVSKAKIDSYYQLVLKEGLPDRSLVNLNGELGINYTMYAPFYYNLLSKPTQESNLELVRRWITALVKAAVIYNDQGEFPLLRILKYSDGKGHHRDFRVTDKVATFVTTLFPDEDLVIVGDYFSADTRDVVTDAFTCFNMFTVPYMIKQQIELKID